MRRAAFVLLLIFLAPLIVRCDAPVRTLAITIDDLPYIPGSGSASSAGNLEEARHATEAILGALTRHKAPAVGFVNEVRLQVPGERDARAALLKRWVDAGMVLGNHTFSHLRLQDTPPERYQDDIVRGDVVTRQLMEARGAPLFFRYPYNSTGPTKEIKEGIQSFLSARGYRLAPFTVEHADYIFDKIRSAAREKGDRDLEARTRSAYLAHLDTMLEFTERLSRETFGREIPQVLLIHASDLNADCLDEMLTKMEKRGYRFVSLEEALKDPAYATPDEYVGPAGISWLHRWSVGLGLPMKLRDEPDPPQWVLDLYKNLS
jgi:peptidoglycan/xylan/chitin deacetylase (PgdA/CDA1 family)